MRKMRKPLTEQDERELTADEDAAERIQALFDDLVGPARAPSLIKAFSEGLSRRLETSQAPQQFDYTEGV